MASVVITKIVLNNFKSYGQETIDNVDPFLNVIVGKNGHGKSNIHHGKPKITSAFAENFRVKLAPNSTLIWVEYWTEIPSCSGLTFEALLFLLTDLTNGTGKIDVKTYMNEVNKAEEMSVIATLLVKNNQMVSLQEDSSLLKFAKLLDPRWLTYPSFLMEKLPSKKG